MATVTTLDGCGEHHRTRLLGGIEISTIQHPYGHPERPSETVVFWDGKQGWQQPMYFPCEGETLRGHHDRIVRAYVDVLAEWLPGSAFQYVRSDVITRGVREHLHCMCSSDTAGRR